MESPWQIREARSGDADALGRLMRSAYAVYESRMEGERLPPAHVDYASEIDQFPTWVAESRGELLGGLIMSFGEREAWISNVAVDPKSQGRGVGGGLIEFAELEAKQRGHSDLRLATHPLLAESVALYRHMGWEEIDRSARKLVLAKAI